MKKKFFSVVLAITILGLTVINGFAAPNISWVSKVSGANTTDVAFRDNYVYAAEGTSIGVYDVTDKTNPKSITKLQLPQYYTCTAVKIRGKYLFAGGKPSIRVYDISDKNNIKYIAGYNHGANYLTGLAVDDNNIYIAAHSNGLKIVRASDEILDKIDRSGDGLVLTAAYAPQQRAIGVITTLNVENNYLYVCTNISAADSCGAFMIYDVSDATNPVLKGQCQLKHIGNPSKYVRMSSVAISGDYAYVGTNDAQVPQGSSGASNGVYIFNVKAAKENSGAAITLSYNLYQIENVTYPRRISKVFINGDFLYINDQDGKQVRIYSVKDPETFTPLYSVQTQSQNVNGAMIGALDKNYIYVADNDAGFAIYKINPYDTSLKVKQNGIEIDEVKYGEINGAATISNYTAQDMELRCIFAVYTGGVLTKCVSKHDVVLKGKENYEIDTTSINIPVDENEYVSKVFLFKDNLELNPITASITR